MSNYLYYPEIFCLRLACLQLRVCKIVSTGFLINEEEEGEEPRKCSVGPTKILSGHAMSTSQTEFVSDLLLSKNRGFGDRFLKV